MASFIHVDAHFINLDHVVSITRLQRGEYEFEFEFVFANGTTKLTKTKVDPSDGLPRGEAVIPALPGWRVIVGAGRKNKFPFEVYDLEEIIAFRIGPDHARPITAETGDIFHNLTQPHDCAIVSPQGEVMDWNERWPNVEAFIAHKRKAYDAEVKARAIAEKSDEQLI